MFHHRGGRNPNRRPGRGNGGNVSGVFYKLYNDEDAEMRGRRQALRFLEGMDYIDSKPQLLNMMLDPRKHATKRIEEILGFPEEWEDIQELLIPLLKHGIHEEVSKPLFRSLQNKYLYTIFLVPGIIDFLAMTLDESVLGMMKKENIDVISLFLILLSKSNGEVRNSEAVASIAKNLKEFSGAKDAQTLCVVLLLEQKEARQTRLDAVRRLNRHEQGSGAENQVACWVTDRIPPGDRHSNDRFNYRDISIVPPADELSCQVPPYLPMASGENAIIDDPISALLDRNFRLLREDAIESMRTSLKERRRPWQNARVVGMEFDRGNTMSFLVQVDPPRRNVDWKRARALNFQSVVAFLDYRNGVVRTGTISISRDDPDEWLNDPHGPVIGVIIEENEAFDAAVAEVTLNKRFNKKYHEDWKDGKHGAALKALSQMATYEMIEVSRSFFAYSSILSGLQSLDNLPFHDEILRQASPLRLPGYFPGTISFPKLGDRGSFQFENLGRNLDAAFLEHQSTLDTSQAKAVKHALTNRVALIQGPPGTGKTFIGGLIAQIILNNTNEKILCLCYTNHALDQFLEHLIDAGEKRIVRLGGRTKSDTLERYGLRRPAEAKGRQDEEASRVIKRVDAQLHNFRKEISDILEEIESPIGWKSPNGGISSALEMHHPDEFQHIRVPKLEDGFQMAGKGGRKKMKEDALWQEFKRGNDMPPYARAATEDPEGFIQFWRMPIADRHDFVLQVERSVLEDSKRRLRDILATVKELSKEREAARRAADMQILREASVIGATTSGAAKYQDILSSIAPGVVMVEEAGEVLESHVLTALSSTNFVGNSEDTKHLILIGDHKQLRPKVDAFNLTKVSGHGYDLDVSLFERLILGGLESASLSTQHRMRPAISNFIRAQTYPHLIDHPSVLEFPDIQGVSSNVVFIDHDNLEDDQEADDLDAKRVSTTKSNAFEADLCVEIVRYLLLQGYDPSKLVVLTPYLGQLTMIIRLMKRELKDVTAYISEKDMEDLEADGQEELECFIKPTKREIKTVRCSSVDNYQGEENDIVIISLVRCNKIGSIGFLKEPQRVNVLLSRARYGMFIIGSTKTLLKSPAGKSTWSTLLDMMKANGQIKKGLPTICRKHPNDSPIELCNKLQFRTHRPNGGCDRPCKFRLPCGHECPQMCHPVDDDHKFAARSCVQACRRIPPECKEHKHPCTKRCNQDCGPCRTPMGPFSLPCGHVNMDIICHETRSQAAIDFFTTGCREVVEHTFCCGHSANTLCGNSRSQNPVCPELCGHIIDGCQHPCTKRCFDCGGTHKCGETCGRTLFCGHDCDHLCHYAEECKPCQKPCPVKCDHSSCSKPCGASCVPCVEECVWECEHQGRCDLVCSAPCTRLPCNKRCQKLLSCGHQCPSVCGEDCPDEKYCVECGSDNVKKHVTDLLELEDNTYAEHDLDADPIIFFPCGHFYGIETLDGMLEMDKAYEKSETGEYVAAKSLFESRISDKPMRCPQCRALINLVRRYGRVLNYKSLQVLERKHMTYIERTLHEISQQDKKVIKTLLKLYEEIESTPMRKVQDACS